MRQELYRPDVSEPPAAYYTREAAQPTDVTLTKDAKTRDAKKANCIARPLMFAGIGAVAFWHSLAGFIGIGVLMVAVNLIAWRYFLKIEREAAARELALHARSLDEE